MASRIERLRNPSLWVEAFVLFNFAGLALDIYVAHSMNRFRHWPEWIPLVFSLIAPVMLMVALWGWFGDRLRLWNVLGHLVGWMAVLIGVVGLILHLESRFFEERTLASLVYAAPFAAPLAYTGIGLLLVMNRMVRVQDEDWPRWVLMLALGGFIGNFIFSVTDHAQNGFFYASEWIPVISSALAVGFLGVAVVVNVGRDYIWLCVGVLAVQALVGMIGAWLHLQANLHGPGPTLFDKMVFGAPVFAPLLFIDMVVLAGIGLRELYRRGAEKAQPGASPAGVVG